MASTHYSTKTAANNAAQKKTKAAQADAIKSLKSSKHNYHKWEVRKLKPENVKLDRAGSTDDIRITWRFKDIDTTHIDKFEIYVEYNDYISGHDNAWRVDTRDSTSVDPEKQQWTKKGNGNWMYEISVGNTWKRVRVKMRARSTVNKVKYQYKNYSINHNTTGKGKNKKSYYYLSYDWTEGEYDFYWFGGGLDSKGNVTEETGVGGYSPWATWSVPASYRQKGHVPYLNATSVPWRFNPAWETQYKEDLKNKTEEQQKKEQEAQEKAQQEDDKINGTPQAPSNVKAEFRNGVWNITWDYPEGDEHVIQETVLERSFDSGNSWEGVGSWSGKSQHAYSDPAPQGQSVIYRVTLKTKNSSASARTDGLDGVPNTPVITAVECTSDKTATVYFTTSGDAGDTAEIYYSDNKSYVEYPDGNDQKKTASFTYYCADGDSMYSIGNIDTSGALYFSMRLKSGTGYSQVSNVMSVNVGATATAPTPTFEAGTVVTDEPVTLTWVHNCSDGSVQTAYHLYVMAGGTTVVDETVTSDNQYRELDLSSVKSGSTIEWTVATAGANGKMGEACATQRFLAYRRPSITIAVDNQTVKELPLKLTATQDDTEQKALEWDVVMTVQEETTIQDNLGNDVPLRKGTEVYRGRIMDGEGFGEQKLELPIGATDADWPDDAKLKIEVSMLTTVGVSSKSKSIEITTDFSNQDIFVYGFARPIGMWQCAIEPMASSVGGNADCTLSIYRINDDGSYTSIVEGVPNNGTVATDPFPNFGECTYRIVANSNKTDRMYVADCVADIEGTSILMQWGTPTTHTETDPDNDSMTEVSDITANWVELPYDIKITEKRQKDVSLKKYIGRTHEVAYYGTLISDTGTWTADLCKLTDGFTLSQLRTLGEYMGNVYVREPSGLGYWAHVDVDSIETSYNSLKQPVSLSVTRVEE